MNALSLGLSRAMRVERFAGQLERGDFLGAQGGGRFENGHATSSGPVQTSAPGGMRFAQRRERVLQGIEHGRDFFDVGGGNRRIERGGELFPIGHGRVGLHRQYTIELMLATETRATPSSADPTERRRTMFQATVRKFARERIAPHVRAMDEAGVFRKDLIQEFFELGLMAIDVPEEYGGQGGYFFQSILAIEELAKVDPSAAVIVDVQNTLFNNAILRWANEEQKRTLSAAPGQGHGGELRAVGSRVGLGCVRAGDPRGGRGRSLPAQRAQAVDHQRGRSRAVPAVRQCESRRRLQGHHGVSDRARVSRVSRSARKRTSWGFARLRPAS